MAKAKTNRFPQRGEFPFPLIDGPSEAPGVTWIRNHSSYLTVGAFTSQLGRVANFVCGTFLNSIIFVPWILLFSLLLGISHFVLLSHPFWAFAAVAFGLGIAILWIRKPSSGNTDGSNGGQQKSVLSFHLGGCVLLAVVAAAALVSVPFVVEYARDQFRFARWGWPTLALTAGGFVASLAVVHQAIPPNRGNRQKVTLVIFLAMGVAGLLALILLLVSFFVYGNPLRLIPTLAPFEFLPEWIFYVALAAAAAGVVLLKCWYSKWLFSWQTFAYPTITLPILILVCIGLAIHRPILDPRYEAGGELSDHGAVMHLRGGIGRLTLPLSYIVSVAAPEDISPDVQRILKTLVEQRRQLSPFYALQPHGLSRKPFSQQHLTPWAVEYFDLAQLFADTGGELADTDPLILEELRHAIAKEYRKVLVDRVRQRQSTSLSRDAINQRIEELCLAEIIKHRVRHHVRSDIHRQFDTQLGQTRLSFMSVISSDSIEHMYQQLKRSGPSAAHQHEMARYIGRSEELADLEIIRDGTIANQGDISFLPEEASSVSRKILTKAKANAIISDTCVEAYLSSITANHFAVLTRKHLDGEFQRYTDAFLNEKVLRLLRSCPSAFVATVATCDIREEAGRPITQADLKDPWWHRYARALEFLSDDRERLAELARKLLCEKALCEQGNSRRNALNALGKYAKPEVGRNESREEQMSLYSQRAAANFEDEEIIGVAMAKFGVGLNEPDALTASDDAVLVMATGPIGAFNNLNNIRPSMMINSLPIKVRMFAIAILVTLVIGFLVDVNANSMHGFYRDQLARAFFLKSQNGELQSDVEVRMSSLSQPGSVAPYLIINAALNLQASRELNLRDRRSDFFAFTKYYCGSERTGYACTRYFERIYRQFRLSTAMAVSAAAASPNMGRNTNGLAVAIMTLLNVRLGYWFPNPRLAESPRFEFAGVFRKELTEQIWSRWHAIYGSRLERPVCAACCRPSTDHELTGLAFSGGGIRSAAFNLGISQALHESDVFKHVDYLSTVSGGGYTGSGIAVAMRKRDEDAMLNAQAKQSQRGSNIMPPVAALFPGRADSRVPVGNKPELAVQKRLPPTNFGYELISRLDEHGQWVNLSDGGHIENLATIELLRRRCKFIIIGDGEADPKHNFNGIGTLMRLAALELGVEIAIDLSPLRLNASERVRAHFVFGRIEYPETEFAARETGVLLYLKSSLTGDENERIKEYKARCKSFPHESTADQFFDLGQFDAYRELGLHVAWKALQSLSHEDGKIEVDFGRFPDFRRVLERRLARVQALS